MSKLHLGTIGWSYNFWKDAFYPPKTTTKDFLVYYASQFNTVEVDSTFYRTPAKQTVSNWKEQTTEDFKLSLKFPQAITHIKRLKDVQSETDIFLSRVELLKEKLGPLLLQFPPNFRAEHLPDLADYLQKLPKQHLYAVEVRDKSWLNNELYSLLKANNIALALVENPHMPQTLEITAHFLYARWEGDRKKVNGMLGKIEMDRHADLEVWAQKIKSYLDKGIEVYGYFGKYFSGFPPSDVYTLKKLLA